MWCKACGYLLKGSLADRCPECGTAFNSDDPSTWLSEERSRLQRSAFVAWCIAAAWPWMIHAMTIVLLVVARLELGRWPNRFGADDPKNFPVVSKAMLLPLMLLIVGGPVCFGLLLGAAWIGSDRRSRSLWLVGIGLASWGLALVVVRWDPAKSWVWLFD